MLVVTKKLYRLAVRIEIYNSVSMRFATLKSPPDDFFVQFLFGDEVYCFKHDAEQVLVYDTVKRV